MHEYEAVPDCRCERCERRIHPERSAGVASNWSTYTRRELPLLDLARVYFTKCIHVLQNSIQFGDEMIEPGIIDLKPRQCGDVPDVIVCDCHQPCPFSSVVYASLIVLRPTVASSKSITAFTSRPVPESSLIWPAPKSLCRIRSPVT